MSLQCCMWLQYCCTAVTEVFWTLAPSCRTFVSQDQRYWKQKSQNARNLYKCTHQHHIKWSKSKVGSVFCYRYYVLVNNSQLQPCWLVWWSPLGFLGVCYLFICINSYFGSIHWNLCAWLSWNFGNLAHLLLCPPLSYFAPVAASLSLHVTC